MALDKKPIRTTRPAPASFRLSEEAVEQLRTLALVLNMKQAEIIESLLEEEYERVRKKYPLEIKTARKTKQTNS